MLYPKIRCILNMFPGDSTAVLYFADTRRRRGTRCCIRESMLSELKNVLGEANVVRNSFSFRTYCGIIINQEELMP